MFQVNVERFISVLYKASRATETRYNQYVFIQYKQEVSCNNSQNKKEAKLHLTASVWPLTSVVKVGQKPLGGRPALVFYQMTSDGKKRLSGLPGSQAHSSAGWHRPYCLHNTTPADSAGRTSVTQLQQNPPEDKDTALPELHGIVYLTGARQRKKVQRLWNHLLFFLTVATSLVLGKYHIRWTRKFTYV